MAALVASAAVAILLLALLLPGVYCYAKLFKRPYRSLNYALERCLARGDFSSSLLDLGWKDFCLPSGRGFYLRGSLLAAADPEAPIVLLLHGIGWNRFEALKYAPAFIRQGWSVVALDLAGHGASEAPRRAFPSFGVHEKHDIAAVVAWLGSALPQASALGIVGESLGAATALQYAAIAQRGSGEGAVAKPPLAFIVADCSFSSLNAQCEHRFAAAGLPKILFRPALALASALCSAFRGFSLDQADPLQGVASLRVPVLFIHGEADDFVPPRMSVEMHEALIGSGGRSELYLVPGAAHAKSYSTDPVAWEKRAIAFASAAIASMEDGLSTHSAPSA
ncbi:MAG TPA: alpha/beta fold hydrolase [Rectinemataceae bacterium]